MSVTADKASFSQNLIYYHGSSQGSATTIFKEMQASNEQVLSHGLRNQVSHPLQGWFVSETLETHSAFKSTLKILHGAKRSY